MVMPRSIARVSLSVLLIACAQEPRWPDNGPCAGSLPHLCDGSVRMVTFPPRDLVCAREASSPCALRIPLRSDEERTVRVVDELGGVTMTYVLDGLSIPEASSDGRRLAVGFDLDGIDSGLGSHDVDADCQQFNPDFFSSIEPAAVGVDNSFQSLLHGVEWALDAADCPGMLTDGCVDGLLRRDVWDGALLLLLEVEDIDSFEHDDAVRVSLYLGRTWDGAPPALDGPYDHAETRLVAGQVFETVRTLAGPTNADILHHRLRVRWPRLDVPRERFGYPSQLIGVELRASVCANGLFNGHLGGRSETESLVAQWVERFGPAMESEVRSVVESFADVSPTDDPEVCHQVSTAYAIAGVRASRLP